MQSGYMQYDTVYCLAGVRLLSVVDSGHTRSGNRSAQRRYPRPYNSGYRTILDLAHLMPDIDRRWLVTSRIDLITFNRIW